MFRKVLVSASVAICICVSAILGAPPASAASAAPSTITAGCWAYTDIPPTLSSDTVSGAVGDTFTIVAGSGFACSLTLTGTVTGAMSIAANDESVYTIVQSGVVSLLGLFSSTPATITVTVVDPVPTPDRPIAASTGPVAMLQQLPLPASGDCADVERQHALWAQGVATPWTKNWAEWSDPVYSGWVCERWVNSDGTAAR